MTTLTFSVVAVASIGNVYIVILALQLFSGDIPTSGGGGGRVVKLTREWFALDRVEGGWNHTREDKQRNYQVWFHQTEWSQIFIFFFSESRGFPVNNWKGHHRVCPSPLRGKTWPSSGNCIRGLRDIREFKQPQRRRQRHGPWKNLKHLQLNHFTFDLRYQKNHWKESCILLQVSRNTLTVINKKQTHMVIIFQ